MNYLIPCNVIRTNDHGYISDDSHDSVGLLHVKAGTFCQCCDDVLAQSRGIITGLGSSWVSTPSLCHCAYVQWPSSYYPGAHSTTPIDFDSWKVTDHNLTVEAEMEDETTLQNHHITVATWCRRLLHPTGTTTWFGKSHHTWAWCPTWVICFF